MALPPADSPGRPEPSRLSLLRTVLGGAALGALLARRADGSELLPVWLECAVQVPLLAVWLRDRLVGEARAAAGVGRRSLFDVLLTILVVVGAAAAAAVRRDLAVLPAATTVFIVGSLLLEALASIYRRLEARTAEAEGTLKVLIAPWLGLILAGTVLLSIPLATQSGVPDYKHNFWLHAVNNAQAAVSSACLVGTTVYDFGREYTVFGQAVLIVITQLAGMAFAAVGRAIVQPFLHNAVRVRTVLYLSFSLQGVGVLAMWTSWDAADAPAWGDRLWWGLVHSCSAVWNNGLVLRPNGLFPYIRSGPIFATITSLSIIGSLGLPVILDLVLGLRGSKGDVVRTAAAGAKRQAVESAPWRRLPSWDAAFAFMLLLAGACLLFLFEAPWKPDVAWSLPESWVPQRPIEFGGGQASLRDDLPHATRWTVAVFISSTLRSAGLQSVSVAEGALSWPSYGFFLLWMFVGGSSGGVGGGMRTTVLSILVVSLLSRRRAWAGHPEGPAIRRMLIRSAPGVFLLCLLLNVAAIALVSWSSDATRYEAVFDAVAASNGVGLSTGVTLHLTWQGRIVIIIIMIVGRLAPVACWLGLSRRITACLRRREDGGQSCA